MLSIFPFFLTFEQIAPLLLRVAVAFAIASAIYMEYKNSGQKLLPYVTGLSYLSLIYLAARAIVSAMLAVGAFVQIACLLALAIAAGEEYKNKKAGLKTSTTFSALYVAACLSLLVLGAGVFAIDLPL